MHRTRTCPDAIGSAGESRGGVRYRGPASARADLEREQTDPPADAAADRDDDHEQHEIAEHLAHSGAHHSAAWMMHRAPRNIVGRLVVHPPRPIAAKRLTRDNFKTVARI